MAQFRYRLQTLLDQKVEAKEEAQQRLASAQRELRTEQDELDVCRREQEARTGRLRRARMESLSPVIGVSSGEQMRLRRDHIVRLQDELHDASDAVAAQGLRVTEAEERLATAREMLEARSRDVEVLEKHRARLERRFNDEAARKEVLEQEEMANIVFLRGRDAT